MLIDRRFLASAVSVLALSVAAPAVAQQMSAKDAWAQLRSLAAGAGLTISSQSVTDNGTSMVANGVRIFPTNEPDDLVLTLDTLGIEPRGDQIALMPSARIGVETRLAGGVERDFEILNPGMGEIVGALTDANATLTVGFPTLTMRMVRSEQGGRPLDEAMDVTFEGFDTTLNATVDGSAEIFVGAASVRYDAVLSTPTGMGDQRMRQTMDGTMEAVALEFTGREMDMLSDEQGAIRRAFDAGMEMTLRLTSGPASGNTGQSGGPFDMTLATTAESSLLEATVRGGRVDVQLAAGAGRYAGGSGPMQGEVTFHAIGFNFGMPLIMTPDDQPARYAFSFDNLTPSPELLQMAGAGAFAGDSLSLALDLGADMRLTSEIGPSWGDSDVPPFDLSRVRLENLLVRVGDSEFTGAGAVTLIGGMLAQIGRPMPEAEGDLTFNLIGGERLLQRVQSLGLVPEDQLFFARMMINGLGRPVGDDHLQSDVAIRPGGVVTVNGAPLPF